MDFEDLADMIKEEKALAKQPPKEQTMFRLTFLLPCQRLKEKEKKPKPHRYNIKYTENDFLSYSRARREREDAKKETLVPSEPSAHRGPQITRCVTPYMVLNRMFLGPRYGLRRAFLVECPVCKKRYVVEFIVSKDRETGVWRPKTHWTLMHEFSATDASTLCPRTSPQSTTNDA